MQEVMKQVWKLGQNSGLASFFFLVMLIAAVSCQAQTAGGDDPAARLEDLLNKLDALDSATATPSSKPSPKPRAPVAPEPSNRKIQSLAPAQTKTSSPPFAKSNPAHHRTDGVWVRHILVETRTEAVDIRGRLEGGASFASMAKRYSKSPDRTKGGDLGRVLPGVMVKEFEEAAFALEAGQISEPVKTGFGWHLIQVYDKKAASVPASAPMKPVPAKTRSADVDPQLDLAFWNSIKDLNDTSMFEAYLEKFPNGTFAPIARAKLKSTPGSQPSSASSTSLNQVQTDTSGKTEALIAKYDKIFRDAGIRKAARYRVTAASCNGCVPFLINCRDQISDVSGLRGRRVGTPFGWATRKQLVQRHGGTVVPLPPGLAEVLPAFLDGKIDCTIWGGMDPGR